MKEKAIEWYKKLNFPKAYDEAFYKLVERVDVEAVSTQDVVADLCKKKDYGLNLVFFLTACEDLYRELSARGLPEAVIYEVARGLVYEAEVCRVSFGEIGVYEVEWFYYVLIKKTIFRVGRLQFEMRRVDKTMAGSAVQEGEAVLSVHIPGKKPLTVEACRASFHEAERFFATYFPEFDYTCFVCDSWMLDESIDGYLGEKSNIRKFRQFFTLYKTTEADDILKFVMGRTVTRQSIASFEPKTGLQAKIKQHVIDGGKLYRSCGRMEKGQY